MDFLTNPDFHSNVLQGLVLTSVALPVLEAIAKATPIKWDDTIVGNIAAVVRAVLPFVPRVRLGK